MQRTVAVMSRSIQKSVDKIGYNSDNPRGLANTDFYLLSNSNVADKSHRLRLIFFSLGNWGMIAKKCAQRVSLKDIVIVLETDCQICCCNT